MARGRKRQIELTVKSRGTKEEQVFVLFAFLFMRRGEYESETRKGKQ